MAVGTQSAASSCNSARHGTVVLKGRGHHYQLGSSVRLHRSHSSASYRHNLRTLFATVNSGRFPWAPADAAQGPPIPVPLPAYLSLPALPPFSTLPSPHHPHH